VDYTSPTLSEALAALAEAHNINTLPSDASLYVKIAPPVHVRVAPISHHPQPTLLSSVAAGVATTAKAGIIENFMSSWTTLVGDPVMSKWIVVILGISVFLNGYLLKGIAAGSGLPNRKASVRFRSKAGFKVDEAQEEEEKVKCEPVSPVIMASIGPVTLESPPPMSAVSPVAETKPLSVDIPKVPKLPILSMPVDLNTVDAMLEKERLQAERAELAKGQSVRPLDEVLEIFENGPRPVSASLALLVDEEVIMLCQAGKIAAYALEKMLGDFERAVTVRRALICELHLCSRTLNGRTDGLVLC
jgi:hydroxymethylglutaryl-CoA reductase (NADPH)